MVRRVSGRASHEGPGRRARGLGAAAALAIGATLTAGPAAGQAPGSLIERALQSRTKGADSARVVVFEIADFQCPYCAQFSQTVAREIDAKYVKTGKIQWVFVNMPLHTHPLAWLAAEAALCAGATGDRFWAMHDRLFEQQQSWGRAEDPSARFAALADSLGVPMEPYRACVAQDQVASLLLQDVGSAVAARVDGTPTFMVMKGQTIVQRLVGVHPLDAWSKVLDEALEPDG